MAIGGQRGIKAGVLRTAAEPLVVSFSDPAATRRLRSPPSERAFSGWLRFGPTALPEHGPPRRR